MASRFRFVYPWLHGGGSVHVNYREARTKDLKVESKRVERVESQKKICGVRQ